MVLLMPVGLVKSDMPNSVSAMRLTSANRTRSSTWSVGGGLHLQHRDHFVALVDEADGEVDRSLDDVLVRDRSGEHDELAVAAHVDRFARQQLLHLLGEA